MSGNAFKKIEKVLSSAERIGVVGSPSSTTQLALDILGSAVKKKLVGELALFSFTQDGKPHYALGQITEVKLRNIWHEEPTIRSLIRQKGSINPISERQDTHLGEMTVSAVFKQEGNKFQPSILGTIPATGTPVSLVADEILDALLESQKNEIFYLGNVYGSKPKLPTWFKHFGTGDRGVGEAYHIGIFGKTGSGKSVLAKMIMLAYARHPEMGIFVIDPQGEFSKDAIGQPTGGFKLPLKDVLEKRLTRKLEVYGVKNLVLDTYSLFEKVLYESSFFEELTIPKGENREIVCRKLVEKLRKNSKIKISTLYTKEAFEYAWHILGDEDFQKIFYRSEASRDRFRGVFESADKDHFYNNIWVPIANLFNPRRKDAKEISELVKTAVLPTKNRPIVIVDLSKEAATNDSDGEKIIWSETIQALVIKRFLDMIKIHGERSFKQNTLLNALVIIDEAHRLAPAGHIEIEEHAGVKHSLVDAARTTRKYGLGWMFISQTLASLDKEIWGQLGVYFFGFGLSAGAEYRTLQEIVGGDTTALKLYRTFRHPQSAFDPSSKEYPFMTHGPVSPLSFAGTPLFLSVFTSPDVFLRENGLNI
ncbi:MAG: ATP-binding protein [Candidatus Marinimicrobia bacterium]|nr:ATP-binding protein [Candidatus Neomarinimicrobiota bacterium]